MAKEGELSEEAKKLYQTSAELAAESNELAKISKEYLQKHDKLDGLLKDWDKIHSTTPFITFSIIFLFTCLVEFYFSKQIYQDIIKQMPAWLIAVGLTGVSVITSKLLKRSLNKASRDRFLYMETRKPGNETESLVKIKDEVKRTIRKQALLGWIFFIGLAVLISYLSYVRAQRELVARIRPEKFNVIDFLPTVFYIVEVFSGLYIIYTTERIIKGISRMIFKKRFDKQLSKCVELTNESIRLFDNARDKGFNPVFNAVNENIHLAFFRNMSKNMQESESYLTPPENKFRTVKFIFTSHKHTYGNATIVTDYGFTSTTAFEVSSDSHKTEAITFEIHGFDTDAIREIVFDFPNTETVLDLVIRGNFEMNSITHTLNIDT